MFKSLNLWNVQRMIIAPYHQLHLLLPPLSSAVLSSQSEASTTGAVAQTTWPIVTRSGRVSRPNPRYQDYTTG